MGTIAEKLSYLNTTKTKIKDVLNLGGANITNETFRQYADKIKDRYLYYMLNGTQVVWNNWNKVSGTGTTLSLNNTEEAPMSLVYKGNTSQSGTPTPTSPQDIHVVSGDNSIEVCGKNLFNKIYFTTKYENWPAYAVHGDTFRLIPFYVGVGTKVTFSSNVPVASSSVIYAVNELDRIQGTTQNININTTRTIEGGSNGYVYLGFVIIRQYYDDLLNGTYWIQIEKGETATNYEASTTYPINLGTMELCKIGGYQDYIYKDNGKWYKYGAIGKVVLNGSESWSDFSVGDTNFRCQYDVALPNILTPPTNPAQLFSNYFKAINRDNAYAKTEIGIAQYGSALGKVFICAPNTILSEQTLASWKTWLSTHNTIVYYVLNTPTTTEITDSTLISQLEALKEAESYSGQTNISQVNNDLPFELDVVALSNQ